MPTDWTEMVRRYRPLAELVPAHWQSGSIVAQDGTPLHYTRTGGQQPALLLLHGIQLAGLTWLRTARALEAEYDVIMPDFRGHGQSGRLTQGLTAGMLVDDTIAVIQALGLETPFVVGHSLGAEVAGRLAAIHPIRAAVLVDPALRNFAAAMNFDLDQPPPWMLPILETIRSLRQQPHEQRMVTGLRLLPPGTPLLNEADHVSFVDAHAQFDLEVYRFAPGMGYLFEAPDVIARIACPILLLTAHPMLPGAAIEAGVAAFEQHWRDGQHIHFAESGHFIMFEQFERFIEVLRRFLQAHE